MSTLTQITADEQCRPYQGGKPVYGLRVQCDEWEAES